PLQAGNSRGHDQGFLAIPYMSELQMYATTFLLVYSRFHTTIAGVKNFATLLVNRYNSVVGCTRSKNSTVLEFWVIIDNMMNLEEIFLYQELTGNRTLVDTVIGHVNRTTIDLVRPDGSSYHVVVYNENTGAAKRGRYIWIRQVYANIINPWLTLNPKRLTLVFNLTTHPHFLETSRQMAKVFLTRLPSNGIPPDFDAPQSNPSDDTSAEAIAAEGLFIYQRRKLKDTTGADYYYNQALLVDNFKFAFKPTWDSILNNGTSYEKKGAKDGGLIYGYYYALQAGNSMLKLGLASC
ncbi:Six-hairpin glycosidase-like protein, partial [Rhizoctonia solani]